MQMELHHGLLGAREGFIGVAMDLRSGQGPNGGNLDYHFPPSSGSGPP